MIEVVHRRAHSAPRRYVESARIPPAPPGECDQVMPSGDSLQSKIAQWMELKRRGTNINDRLRSSKGFRNPDFLQSVVEHFNIDQHGTLFAPEVFNPKAGMPKSHHILSNSRRMYYYIKKRLNSYINTFHRTPPV